MSTSPASLLARAHTLLDGSGQTATPSAGPNPPTDLRSSRAAAWLARTALEIAVTSLLTARGLHAEDATMRSRLACLQVTHPDLAHDASAAWWSLSRCYHHHAFELTPAPHEVAHLLDLVQAVVTATDNRASEVGNQDST